MPVPCPPVVRGTVLCPWADTKVPSFLIAPNGAPYDGKDTLAVVTVHGSGFDPEFGSGHFRTITLPPMEVLEEAYDKIERFIKHNTA